MRYKSFSGILAGAFPYFPTAAAVSDPAGAPSISPHCRSSVYPHLLLPLPTLPQQHTSAEAASSKMPQHHYKRCPASHQPKPCNFLGGLSAAIWLLSHDKHFWGAFGSGPNAELGPLSPGEGSTPGSGTITELGALSSDSTPNTHTVYSVHY